MKTYKDFKTEMEQVIKEVDEKTKDWSDKDHDDHWKKVEQETRMEYFKDLSEGNIEPNDCIYRSFYDESFQRRKKTETEYVTKVNKLFQDLKDSQGNDKIDVIGSLIKIVIQFQLFGMK